MMPTSLWVHHSTSMILLALTEAMMHPYFAPIRQLEEQKQVQQQQQPQQHHQHQDASSSHQQQQGASSSAVHYRQPRPEGQDHEVLPDSCDVRATVSIPAPAASIAAPVPESSRAGRPSSAKADGAGSATGAEGKARRVGDANGAPVPALPALA